ncbi:MULTISPECIES: alcohol dehydrogenase catalytic domain-containing protein [unclassified Microbacterium]|uniref:alcohol dehydrogenase catalytic domain-containing protein n=1 Tax=unclassified Microbacterium TaxID=2609290 RepID=UPI001FCE72DF|nr:MULTISPECIES: alcohol dehydrogenase catalytic domain-containing protein [unclassified Microbacterium]
MTETMSAWRRETYGPAEGVALERIPVPVPHHGEVLLRVRATGLNAGDVRLLLGDPLLVRPVFGLTRPKHPVRGMEVAGTVVAVAPDVVSAEVGEEVVGELVGGGGLGSTCACPPRASCRSRPTSRRRPPRACRSPREPRGRRSTLLVSASGRRPRAS